MKHVLLQGGGYRGGDFTLTLPYLIIIYYINKYLLSLNLYSCLVLFKFNSLLNKHLHLLIHTILNFNLR